MSFFPNSRYSERRDGGDRLSLQRKGEVDQWGHFGAQQGFTDRRIGSSIYNLALEHCTLFMNAQELAGSNGARQV